MTQPRYDTSHEAVGKPAAAVAWGLYIFSIPSFNVAVLIGLLVAYAARSGSTGLARQHIDAQIRLFWSVVWWTIACWILIVVGIPLMVVLLGFLMIGLGALGLLVIHLWFTVKSIIGLINLLQDRPA